MIPWRTRPFHSILLAAFQTIDAWTWIADPRVTALLGIAVEAGLGKAVLLPRGLECIGSLLAFGKSLGGLVLRGPPHGREPLQSFPETCVPDLASRLKTEKDLLAMFFGGSKGI